jgi:ATP-dependent exoDNAse (exonuclease V) beta subunit
MTTDAAQRDMAVNIAHSCIVQAPAGSGKTELLIQRTLALLAQVKRPQQVLAITFTNKAAAEMQERLLDALRSARDNRRPAEAHALKTWELAKAVLARHGDHLLRNPGQLSIQTIDSFNASLVRKMPWTSRFGSIPEVSDDPESLYQRAVEKLLERLHKTDSGSSQLQIIHRHLDNQVTEVQKMLVDMLKRRDQWLGLLGQNLEGSHGRLQQAVEALCCDSLLPLRDSFPPALTEALLFCARYAGAQLEESPLARLQDMTAVPGSGFRDLPDWLAISELLLTGSDDLRKRVNVNNGFPPGSEHQEAKERMQQLLQDLTAYPRWTSQLARIRRLPSAGYSSEQWLVLQSLIQLLPQLVAELWLVFRAQGQVDFVEIALKALQSLGASDNPSQLLLQLDQELQHILVDEFQDTSRLQYRLLSDLISGWTQTDGRTLFLVGDPMQSIYRFREAEVGLFLQSFQGHFGDSEHALKTLKLTANFRSQKGLVDWVNGCFSCIFPADVEALTGAVPLAESTAVKPPLPGQACQIYPYVGRDDQAEARQVLAIIQQARIEDPEQTIAVLVRGRTHLRELLPLLRHHQIAYQAQDIDLLGASPAALDIVHLTRAILHRADRLSWLAVLRAHWCGLTLKDLHALLDAVPGKTVPGVLAQVDLWHKLSEDGQRRLTRIWPVLQRGLERRGRLPLRSLVEGSWLALGAPACYSTAGLSDAQLVFALLEKSEVAGDLMDFAQLDQGLNRFFAEPDSTANENLQIMTIHKAKGLEFDTVIIPGLGKLPRRQDSPLLRWLDHPKHGLIMAPVSAKAAKEKDALYRLLAQIESDKSDLEASRLLYVATTRAIRRLHLLGHAEENSRGELRPQSGSLLEKLWPLVNNDFQTQGQIADVLEPTFISPRLTRLPGDWEPPELISVALPELKDAVRASDHEDADPVSGIFSGWEDPVHRHVGNVMHRQLENIAKLGEQSWRAVGRKKTEADLSRSLMALGINGKELESHCRKIYSALDRCLNSQRGRWILTPHEQHASELPLSGVVDGRVVRAVIDRTFIAEGSRWVIDYKTSIPQPGEALEAFFRREAEQYKKQLNTYVQLFELSNEGLPVRPALYFPLIDGWYEL